MTATPRQLNPARPVVVRWSEDYDWALEILQKAEFRMQGAEGSKVKWALGKSKAAKRSALGRLRATASLPRSKRF